MEIKEEKEDLDLTLKKYFEQLFRPLDWVSQSTETIVEKNVS